MNSGRDNQGMILIAVLWMIAVMTALAAIVGQTSRLNMKMAASATDEVRCKWACRAGTENAIAVLTEDLKDSDSLLDLWSDNDEDFNDVELERCRYTVRVTDEAGKLNINTVTKDQLMALPYMEEYIADAILDWRDGDDEPRTQGVEAGYYENLLVPYKIRNGPLRTIRELLQVKGVTEDLLYGEDTNLNGQLDANEKDRELSPPLDNGDEVLDQGWIAFLTCYSYEKNVDAAGNARVNINQADQKKLESDLGLSSAQAKWIVDNRGGGYKSIADLLNDKSPKTSSGQSSAPGQNQAEPIDWQTFGQIADKITVSGEQKILGRVNINTAPREVLVALFGGDDQAEQLAHTVMANRSSLMYGFQSIAELLDQQGMTLEKFKALAEQITVRSDVYTIRCFATAQTSGARMQTECVVDRGQTPCAILYGYQGANY
ncbi:MAG: type II secretion system protein GspK [Planctomycetes bacterium]|nr:type II secretion system protein GspK [Planctomycetota bacterium]